MHNNFLVLKKNVETIRENIAAALKRSNRNPSEVTFVAVTKTRPAELVGLLADLGFDTVGENRVQEARQKRPLLDDKNFQWHLIGHLQSNKARHAVEIFDCIHSVDSLRLATEINRRCDAINKDIDVLIEVNVSGEEAKYGVASEQVEELALEIEKMPRVNLIGLMTMAPLLSDAEETRPVFRGLRELRDKLQSKGFLNIHHLSMGMTQDYTVAIEEGATMLRIGSAIFAGCEGC
jgi:PLP dependent protein